MPDSPLEGDAGGTRLLLKDGSPPWHSAEWGYYLQLRLFITVVSHLDISFVAINLLIILTCFYRYQGVDVDCHFARCEAFGGRGFC